MKYRNLAALFSVIAVLGAATALIRAQPPERPSEGSVKTDRARLRAEIIKLRTEVEMLQFDYDLARDGLINDVKTRKGFRMAGVMMQLGAAINAASNEASTDAPAEPPRKKTEQEKKKAEEEAKKAEQEQKKAEEEDAAFIAAGKKELARRMAALAERRLDLEDAERAYSATFR